MLTNLDVLVNPIPYKESIPPLLSIWLANGEDPATHFTIAEAEAEWGLPENGFDYGGRDKITYDGNLPDGFEAGVSVLNGSEGSYSWA